jgi:hypothetical protein
VSLKVILRSITFFLFFGRIPEKVMWMAHL